MKRYFVLSHAVARQNAVRAVSDAPDGYTVTIDEPKLTGQQRKIFYAMCGDLERSGFIWDGKKRTKDEWKVLLISAHQKATGGDIEVIVGLEGEMVQIRESMATMGKLRTNSLIEYTQAFCAHNDVRLSA